MNKNFMRKKIAGEWIHNGRPNDYGNISYVYCIFANDENKIKNDVTYHYTNVTNITLNITNKYGEPIEDVKVKVFSHNRWNWFNNDGIGITKKTNETGKCSFTIGGGRYHFECYQESSNMIYKTEIIEFNEHISNHYYDIMIK